MYTFSLRSYEEDCIALLMMLAICFHLCFDIFKKLCGIVLGTLDESSNHSRAWAASSAHGSSIFCRMIVAAAASSFFRLNSLSLPLKNASQSGELSLMLRIAAIVR